MHLRRSSAAGSRFLALVREGRGLKPSARAAGIGKATGYRWLREAFVELRAAGVGVAEAQEQLGFASPLVLDWERGRVAAGSSGRHHLAVDEAVEDVFWARFDRGANLEGARRAAGVGRSTAYRWWRRRFGECREQGLSVRAAAASLRIAPAQARRWELDRRALVAAEQRTVVAADLRAVQSVARHRDLLARPELTQRQLRDIRYWELMRSGMTNTAACKILGVSRQLGTRIRQRSRYQTRPPAPPEHGGRYLSLWERLKIADLLGFGWSLRRIAGELGRSPSTVKRELDRHRDVSGRYLPQSADHAAKQQRRRPRQHKLVANARLRKLVQRKLNRYWSPDEICGWLRRTHPDDQQMRLSPETIYRALLVPGGRGLHERYCQRLRTGRRIRRSRWLSSSGHGAVVRGMTMISERPVEVERRERVGDWEGDLIVGVGSASAMVTLRERVTQYGIVVNLPDDHTAASVNRAVIAAFAGLPPQLKQTLTWDQGVEMARHQDLAAATGVPVFFAERSSPWQRGANENYNRLLRQYFAKGTDLSLHSTEAVKTVENELNTRPRKGLGYATPAEKLREAMRQAARSTGTQTTVTSPTR